MHVIQWISVASVCIATGLGQAATITVDDDLQDLPTADYTNIQAAVDAASDGDEVVVYPGTYTDTQDGHVVNMLGKAITLRSTGTADVTIIDGENARRGIVCVNAEPSSTTIDGFTISGGLSVEYDYDGDGSADSWENDGGGILCYLLSSPTITNCTITNNTANDDGGGIYCYLLSSPTITNCTITNNTATYSGGGIYCSSSNPTITNCTITNNTANDDGGGIYYYSSSSTIQDCTITNNTANDDGGGIYCYSSSPTIQDCTITNNTANDDGGGIQCSTTSDPTITDTNICGNASDQVYGSWTDGGGVCIAFSCDDNDGDGVPDKCQGSIGDGIHEVPSEYATIQEAIEAAGYGDTVLVGPGTWTSSADWVINPGGKPITIRASGTAEETILDGQGERRVVRCTSGETASTVIEGFTILGGAAETGAGIFCDDSSPSIINCMITNNTATYNGGGIYCVSSDPTITNCTISDNTANDDGGGIYCASSSSNPTITDTNICGNASDQVWGSWTDGGGTCIAFSCDDNDGDGVPDKCQGSIGDGIHEVPSEYATVQAAIEAAGYGDTVLVGPGTYTGTGDWVINPGGKPITIRATGTPEETILDGQGERCVVQCAGGETASTVIEGFTITGGSATYGGGIYCNGSDPTITNCTITNNTANYGGGIYCRDSNPTITNCTITNNTATYRGGGIYCSSSDPTITNCTISDNTANDDGGGIYCSSSSDPTITNCTISDNTANDDGGGIYCSSSSDPTITESTVVCNTPNQIYGSWTDGGGTCVATYCIDTDEDGIIDECDDQVGDGIHEVPGEFETIDQAIAVANDGDIVLVGPGTYTGTGDWVINPGGKPITIRATGSAQETILDGQGVRRVVQCTSGETASTVIEGFTITGGSANDGGGIYCNGSDPTITNCTITNNTANYGGGIFCYSSDPTITNCTISDNTANDDGGGIYCYYSSEPTITTCTISNNTAAIDGGGLYIQVWNISSPPILTYCIIANNVAGNAGGGIHSTYSTNSPLLTDMVFCENGPDAIYGNWNDNGWNLFWDACNDCNGNGVDDQQDIFSGVLTDVDIDGLPDQCEYDCDDDGVPDPLEIYQGTQFDIDDNGHPDECEDCDGDTIPDSWAIENGLVPDCNSNGLPDSCDLDDGTATDCNANGELDSCEIADAPMLDCDGNGLPDECDITNGLDCNGNGIVDACDIADGTSEDCNGNGTPDECDFAFEHDCNGNGVPDTCDLADGTSEDCNGNGTPDECDITNGLDCNGNGIVDACDIADGTSEDCNGNGTPDECDFAFEHDCNGNGVPDTCDLADGTSEDCNNNLVPDTCDIASGLSQDIDGDGVPDECPLACSTHSLTHVIEAPSDLHEGFGWMMDAAMGLLAVRSEWAGFEYLTLYNTTDWTLVQDLRLPWQKAGITSIIGDSVAFGGDFLAASGTWDTDRVAIYQPSIDGTWAHTGTINAPSDAGQYFGFGLAASGDRIAVIDYLDYNGSGGHVYIYHRHNDGTWMPHQTIEAPDGSASYWGIAIAMNNDWLVVGSPEAGVGSIEFYRNDGDSYLYHSTIVTAGAPAWSDLNDSNFGWGSHIAIDNETLIVGAGDYFWDGPGWVDVYELEGDSWIHTATPTPVGLEDDEIFGASVDIQGDRISIGAITAYNSNALHESGATYVFDRNQAGIWQQVAKVDAPNPDFAAFGASCRLIDRGVATGAPYPESRLGDVYIANINTALNPIDCNGNGICDGLDIAADSDADCDQSGILDECEIEDGLLDDIDGNGLPDVCEADCDGDGWPDAAEILNGWASDCNGNLVPDECDIAAGNSPDSNGDGVPDECESGYVIYVAQDGSALFEEIQPAINLAISGIGTVIRVAPGEYEGELDFQGKAITIQSESGSEFTSITGGTKSVYFVHGENGDSVLSGFSILSGGGIYCFGSSPRIEQCDIYDNVSYAGGGIYCQDGAPTIVECVIHDNIALDTGGGIYCAASSPILLETIISHNFAGIDGGGIYSAEDGNPTLINSSVCENDPEQIYGPWTDGGGACIAFSCIDSDGDGVPDKCQGSIGDGIHEVPSEYATIQEAIEAAGYGDTVLVGPGTWTSSADWVINPGGKPITIRASGTAEETILDGQGARRVVRCTSGESNTTVIEGFTILGGAAETGAGIFCDDSSPSIINCMITNNTANDDGGGIYCYSSSNPTITNCTITNNTANDDGGGIYCYSSSNPTITNCTITNNTASNGGGISCWQSSPTITDCTISDNTASSGGGIYCFGSDPTITNCTITDNTATIYGGGGICIASSPTITDCTITNNTANYGGGIYCYSSSNPTIQACTLEGNTAASSGGGLYSSTQYNSTSTPRLLGSHFCTNLPNAIAGPIWPWSWYYLWDDCGDCNGNGIPDAQDIADGTVTDVDQDGLPDECEFDCDSDGITDPIEIWQGTQFDIDEDGLPDDCEDCDGDQIPDDFAIELGFAPDCNGNFHPDACDIQEGIAPDCDGNGVPDACDIQADPSLDCDQSNSLDSCDIMGDSGLDCDGNGSIDTCELLDNPDLDCNIDAILDACQLDDPLLNCNSNTAIDSCEVADGTAEDVNSNGVPDECDCLADLNGDGIVGVDDLLLVVSQFGLVGGSADLNYDGVVGVEDLLELLSQWGPCEI